MDALLNSWLPARLNALSGMFSSLKSANYRRYFYGQCISLSGSWMQQVAMSWLVYRLTGSVFLLGFVGFCTQVPSFVLSPVTGVYVDRFSKRRVLFWAQVSYMLTAFFLSALVFLGWIEVWHIVVLSLLNGVITAVDTPSRQALVIELVPQKKDLGNAIALNSAVFNGTRLIGPSLGGLLIAAVGEGYCFLINGLSFIAMIVALLRMDITDKPRKLEQGGVFREMREGFAYVSSAFSIRTLLLLLAALSLVGIPYIVIIPAFVSEIMGGDSRMLGFVMSFVGVGAFVAALLLAARKSVSGLPGNVLFMGILFGLSLVALSFLTVPWMTYPVFVVAGFSMIFILASVNTLIQTLVDDDKRGRVMSIYGMALMGTVTFGNLLQGTLADHIGIPATILSSGVACVVVALFYGRWCRRVHTDVRAHLRRVKSLSTFKLEI